MQGSLRHRVARCRRSAAALAITPAAPRPCRARREDCALHEAELVRIEDLNGADQRVIASVDYLSYLISHDAAALCVKP